MRSLNTSTFCILNKAIAVEPFPVTQWDFQCQHRAYLLFHEMALLLPQGEFQMGWREGHWLHLTLRGEEMKASCVSWLVKLLVDSLVLCGSVAVNGLSIRKVRFTPRLAPGHYCIDVGVYIHINTPSLTNCQKKQICHFLPISPEDFTDRHVQMNFWIGMVSWAMSTEEWVSWTYAWRKGKRNKVTLSVVNRVGM